MNGGPAAAGPPIWSVRTVPGCRIPAVHEGISPPRPLGPPCLAGTAGTAVPGWDHWDHWDHWDRLGPLDHWDHWDRLGPLGIMGRPAPGSTAR